MKRILLAALLTSAFMLIFSACNTANSGATGGGQLTITPINSGGQGHIMLYKMEDNGLYSFEDTLVQQSNGQAAYSLKTPGFYKVSLFDVVEVPVLSTGNDISLSLDLDDPRGSLQMTGDYVDQVKQLNDKQPDLNQNITTLRQEYAQAARQNNTAQQEAKRKAYAQANQELQQLLPSLQNIPVQPLELQAVFDARKVPYVLDVEGHELKNPRMVQLSGTIQNMAEPVTEVIVWHTEGRQEAPVDTFAVQANGTYSGQVLVKEQGFFVLTFGRFERAQVILDTAPLTVNLDGATQQGPVASGNPHVGYMQALTEIINSFQGRRDNFQQKYQELMAAQASNQAEVDAQNEAVEQLKADFLALFKEQETAIVNYATQNITEPSLAVLQAMMFVNQNLSDYYDQFNTLTQKLVQAMPGNKQAQLARYEIEQMAPFAIGQMAPDLALPDRDGNLFGLADLKGKYVLLDFWAYWCGPCREENPNIVQNYNRFKDQGFTVLGVSLDQNRENWIKGIEQDGLEWNHISDLRYWYSYGARRYRIQAIPASYLIDPDGRIIGKNLRGPALTAKLEEIFKANPS